MGRGIELSLPHVHHLPVKISTNTGKKIRAVLRINKDLPAVFIFMILRTVAHLNARHARRRKQSSL
jgi:hypothetical protein